MDSVPLVSKALWLMKKMELKIMEDKIISAVRNFASSINSGRKVVADMSELIEVTSLCCRFRVLTTGNESCVRDFLQRYGNRFTLNGRYGQRPRN